MRLNFFRKKQPRFIFFVFVKKMRWERVTRYNNDDQSRRHHPMHSQRGYPSTPRRHPTLDDDDLAQAAVGRPPRGDLLGLYSMDGPNNPLSPPPPPSPPIPAMIPVGSAHYLLDSDFTSVPIPNNPSYAQIPIIFYKAAESFDIRPGNAWWFLWLNNANPINDAVANIQIFVMVLNTSNRVVRVPKGSTLRSLLGLPANLIQFRVGRLGELLQSISLLSPTQRLPGASNSDAMYEGHVVLSTSQISHSGSSSSSGGSSIYRHRSNEGGNRSNDRGGSSHRSSCSCSDGRGHRFGNNNNSSSSSSSSSSGINNRIRNRGE
jgi:hypothetical protein